MAEQNQTIGRGMGWKKNVMDQDKKAGLVLEQLRIPTQVKLAGLWVTVMFMYIYVDIIGFFAPGVVEGILAGKTWVFDITQTFLLSGVMLMTIPALMVVLSLTLPAKANRYANIGVGGFYVFLALGLAVGEVNAYYLFGSAVEAVLLSWVVWTAWKWPKVQGIAQVETVAGQRLNVKAPVIE
jgi:Family of unknown function (DUF6326)